MHPWQQSQKHKPGHDGRPAQPSAAAAAAIHKTQQAETTCVVQCLRFHLLPCKLSEAMKDRRGSSGGGDRFAVFPFSMGCMSQSAVSVADPTEKKPQSDPSSSSSSSATAAHKACSEEGAGESVKEKAAAAAEGTPPSPGLVAAGVSRLMKGIKSLSLMFAGDGDDEEEDDEEREMVIGFPTDVQHVGHIGWDGHNKVGGAMAMVNAFSLPSTLSFRQLEMAMDHATHASA